MEEVERYADIICNNGPIAVQSTKKAVLSLMNQPIDLAFREEWSYSQESFQSRDAKEGIPAFAEKSPPTLKEDSAEKKRIIMVVRFVPFLYHKT